MGYYSDAQGVESRSNNVAKTGILAIHNAVIKIYPYGSFTLSTCFHKTLRRQQYVIILVKETVLALAPWAVLQ